MRLPLPILLLVAVVVCAQDPVFVPVDRIEGVINCEGRTTRMSLISKNPGGVARDLHIRAFGEDVRERIPAGVEEHVSRVDGKASWIAGPGKLETMRLRSSIQEAGRDLRIRSTRYKLLLPAGVEGVIRANVPFVVDGTKENGQTVVRLDREDAYATEVRVIYTRADATLQIRKRVDPESIGPQTTATITLEISNLGPAPTVEVDLKDDLDPDSFDQLDAPGGAFRSVKSTRGNDGRLHWTGRFQVTKGTPVQVRYQVRSRKAVPSRRLSAARAYLGEDLVGVSDRPRLKPPPRQ